MSPQELRKLRIDATKLVKCLSTHNNVEKATKLLPRAIQREVRRAVAIQRLKYPSYRVVKPA